MDLDQLQRLEAEWKSLQPLAAELDKKLWEKLRLEWNYNSNHIEGNTLTYKETEMYLLRGQTSGVHVEREYVEMKGHDYAIEIVRELASSSEDLTEADIRNLNQVILKESFYKDAITPDGRPARKQIVPGRYKTEPNSVLLENGEIFPYADPIDVPERMAKLIEVIQISADKVGFDFLAMLAATHHEFVLIHPFDDGNGRVSRLLMNYVLLKKGLPPLVVPSKRKTDYLKALQEADAGDLGLLTDFVGEQLIWSLELGIKASKRESLEEPSDIEKEIALFVREQKAQTKPVLKRDYEVAIKFLKTIAYQLFDKIDQRTKQLGDIFESRSLRISGNASGGNSTWKESIEALIAKKVGTGPMPTVVHLNLALKGYTGRAPHPFSIDQAFSIHIGDYEYTVSFYSQVEANGIYSNPMSEEKADKLVSEFLKKLLMQIKNLAGE